MNYDHMRVADYRAQLAREVRADDSSTSCHCCGHRVRNDAKSLNRYMGLALLALARHSRAGEIVHLATFLQRHSPEATRDHCAALLRYWGFIVEHSRPDGSAQKGSRGHTGYVSLSAQGRLFATGMLVAHNTIRRKFGTNTYVVDPSSRIISIHDALVSRMKTAHHSMVADGTTAED